MVLIIEYYRTERCVVTDDFWLSVGYGLEISTNNFV